MTLTVAAVILTTGSAQAALGRAIDSINTQEPRFDEVVVVWNGLRATELRSSVELVNVEVETNSGVPGGRNLGVAASTADIVVFLDDDATIKSTGLVGEVVDRFVSDPNLGVIAFRVEDPVTGEVLRRWTPRMGSNADRPGPVTRFPGGASAIRRQVFTDLDGFEAGFFYGHEEPEFSLRVLNAGHSIEYVPELVILHPARGGHTSPERVHLLGRNRVWLAKLRLPWPVAAMSILIWLVAGPLRSGSFRSAWAYLTGWATGLIQSPGTRYPVSWRTVGRMTRIGQPPIV